MNPIDSTFNELIVVTNREPFSHTYQDDGINVSYSTGGLTTALNDVAGSLCDFWIAWGSGDADFDDSVINENRIVIDDQVDKGYKLRRIKLTAEQIQSYYYGYSNQTLWPLCHNELEHTKFDHTNWTSYQQVNKKFADAVVATDCSKVWIHDYHLTLLPRYVRDRSDYDLTLVHFWHIPWPPLDIFEICPQRESILHGLLANDALGFHIERFRQHFLECVEAILDGAKVNWESGAVRFDGRQTTTYVEPAGVNLDSIKTTLANTSRDKKPVLSTIYDIDPEQTLAIGIDRLDYTKGILERLKALERAFETTPGLQNKLVYLQIASKSREKIPSYRQYHRRVLEKIDEINEAYGTGDRCPIVYTDEILSREDVLRVLKRADMCIVSSRRDGLNLIAQEFIAASRNSPGELLLSEFAGAAEILAPDATRINPFDTVEFAETIVESTRKSEEDHQRQISRLLEDLEDASIEDWIECHVAIFEANPALNGDS